MANNILNFPLLSAFNGPSTRVRPHPFRGLWPVRAAALFLLGCGLAGQQPRAAWPMVNLGQQSQLFSPALAWDSVGNRLYASQPGLNQVSALEVQRVEPIFRNPDRHLPGAWSADGTAAAEAHLGRPRELLAAPDGRILMVCQYWQVNPFDQALSEDFSLVHEVDSAGRFRTLAGTADGGLHPGAEPVAPRRLRLPLGEPNLALTSEGELILGTLTRILAFREGAVTTVAGTGRFGSTGDGGLALEANLRADRMAAGPDGSLFIVEASSANLSRVRKLTLGSDGRYRIRTICEDIPGVNDHLDFDPLAITVAPDGRVFVLSVRGTRIEQLTPQEDKVAPSTTGGACGSADGHASSRDGLYVRSTLAMPRSVLTGLSVPLQDLVAAGDDSFFALERDTGNVLFLGPEREGDVLAAIGSLASFLEEAPTQPPSQASQEHEAPAVQDTFSEHLTQRLRRLGKALPDSGPNLLTLLRQRELDPGNRVRTPSAQSVLARRTLRRALLNAVLPDLGVPRWYLANHDVDSILAEGRAAEPAPDAAMPDPDPQKASAASAMVK